MNKFLLFADSFDSLSLTLKGSKAFEF